MVCSFMFVIEGQTDLYESCTGKLTMSVFKMELPRSGLLEQTNSGDAKSRAPDFSVGPQKKERVGP